MPELRINITDEEIKLLTEIMQVDKDRFANPANSLEEYIMSTVISLAKNRLRVFVTEELGNMTFSELKELKEKRKDALRF